MSRSKSAVIGVARWLRYHYRSLLRDVRDNWDDWQW